MDVMKNNNINVSKTTIHIKGTDNAKINLEQCVLSLEKI